MSRRRLVAVVDDDEAVRKSITRLLRRAGHETVGYDGGETLITTGTPPETDVILLDVKMPVIDGIEVLRRLRCRPEVPPIIVVTGFGDVPLAVEAMKLGAAEFLEKPLRLDKLLDAIERAVNSKAICLLANPHQREAYIKVKALTARQREVLAGIAVGKPTKVIAHNLGLSVRTVDDYRARLFDRLGVRSVAEAVRIALLAGLTR